MERLSKEEMLEKLRGFNTPTVSNIVATYPTDPLCLSLYNPWKGRWYTDQSVRCVFPEMGRRIGHVVTMVRALPDPDYPSLTYSDLIDALDKAKKPIIVVCQQDFPDGILDRSGLFGGQSTALFKACGVVGVVTNGPSRDLDEMRTSGVQYILSGTTAGHGEHVLRALNVPVSVAGMEVKPGDMVHMDEHGACKFPEDKLADICNNIDALVKKENDVERALGLARTVEKIKEVWPEE